MSNFTEVEVELSDLGMTKRALDNMGVRCELHSTPVTINGYNGRVKSAQLVVRNHNRYGDLGFFQDNSGKVSVIVDEGHVDKGWLQRVSDEYALETMKEKVSALGFRIEDVNRVSGGIDVTINNPFN